MDSEKYLLPKYKDLRHEYDAVVQCNRCGFCETVCPTYVVSGKETLSPRGRNQAFRQILEGKMQKAELASEIFSTCLTCHACTNVCFSQVPVGKLMAHARSIVNEEKTPGWIESFIFRHLLSRRKLFSILMWFGFLLKKLQIPKLLSKNGLLKKISPELDAAEALVEDVPLKFGGGHVKTQSTPAAAKNQSAAYFSGCGIHYLYPSASKACVEILSAAASKLSCPSHACCGLPANSAGDIESAKKLARKNIERFAKENADVIVVNDDSCCGFMKNYGELLEGDLGAIAFSKKVKNLSEFLTQSRNVEFFSKGFEKQFRVTYHDPCQMGNGQHQFSEPREILKRLPGIDFVEMDESNWCCGGAGTYCLKHPHLAEDVLERKLENIKSSGAQIVVTQASSCLIHIQYGLRKKGWENEIQAMHLAELLTACRGVRSLPDGT